MKDKFCSIRQDFQLVVLQSHGIPDDAYEALERNDATDFINARMQHLIQLEREFMQQLGINPPL